MVHTEPRGTPRYWFRAKRYGWGWGPPATWQGWLVLGMYVVALGALFRLAPAHERPGAFVAGLVGATSVLLLVCWRTGEPPRWRWGEEGDGNGGGA